MRHTLVAAFATPTDASRTYGDLMSRGIAREQIHMVGADSAEIHGYDEPYSTADGTVDRTHHESKVAHFFKSLFGHQPHEAHRHHATAYPEAVRRGATVIAVDARDDDELVKVRDALEYNGALNVNERGGDSATPGYAGPTSPYAGATGGDSHLDKHFAGNASTTSIADNHNERQDETQTDRLDHAAGAGPTDQAHPTAHDRTGTVDTGRYEVGSDAKRAGTDYPGTLATNNATGAGPTGREVAEGVGTREAGMCTDRVCVIQRPS
ncbi:hypothetical protein JNA64_09820 [Pseudomonas stutzeri]|uniref:hypothetical protein n=1 Tax=Stutzerimonas stutzeri TaxID=316 RepID=UPI001F519E87|nr:hypothetical protein [Stutzerimonas stutzeri]MCI0917460.1 hypothetical protein [Stutzerimonas stutzeri]